MDCIVLRVAELETTEQLSLHCTQSCPKEAEYTSQLCSLLSWQSSLPFPSLLSGPMVNNHYIKPPLNNQEPINGLCVVQVLSKGERQTCLSTNVRREMHLLQISASSQPQFQVFQSSLATQVRERDHKKVNKSQLLQTCKHSCSWAEAVQCRKLARRELQGDVCEEGWFETVGTTTSVEASTRGMQESLTSHSLSLVH